MMELRKAAIEPIWDQGETKNLYCFPIPTNIDFSESADKLSVDIPKNELYRIGNFLCAKSPQSHIGPFTWAIDFLIPDGTEIYAAEEGKIIEAVDSFSEWGDSEEFRDKLNYITIQHNHGEFSQYCHLAPGSFQTSKFKVGSIIPKGAVIGRVGKTGWTDRDHLHFIVFKVGKIERSPFTFYSLKIRFEE